jgi:hypothetical protein
MEKKKKLYQPPSLKKVRLDIKASVLGDQCFTSTNTISVPVCLTVTCLPPGT